MSKGKDFKPIIAELKSQGWAVTQTGQAHWKAVPPDNTKSLVHFSSSNEPRALKNTLQDLRRSGFLWPPPDRRDSSPSSRERPIEPDWFEDEGVSLSQQPAANAEPQETEEEKMERVFAELKEAKSYLALTDDNLKECEARFQAAQKALEAARAEREQAAATLRGKKTAFDEAFSVAAA